MDALLQIIVPRIDYIEGVEITQPIYEWGGVKYPQGPRIVSWKDVTLSFEEPQRYPKRFLPPGYSAEDWVWMKVSDDTLDRYDVSIKSADNHRDAPNLESFLRLLLNVSENWILGFLAQCDQIDNVYKLSVEDAITKLRNNLKPDMITEGFIAYG